MRRLFRVRIAVVLIALIALPALALPFAERIRTEWARFWEPTTEEDEFPALLTDAFDDGNFSVSCGWCGTCCPGVAPDPVLVESNDDGIIVEFLDDETVAVADDFVFDEVETALANLVVEP